MRVKLQPTLPFNKANLMKVSMNTFGSFNSSTGRNHRIVYSRTA